MKDPAHGEGEIIITPGPVVVVAIALPAVGEIINVFIGLLQTLC